MCEGFGGAGSCVKETGFENSLNVLLGIFCCTYVKTPGGRNNNIFFVLLGGKFPAVRLS